MEFTERYNDVKKLYKPGIRSFLRNYALSGLSFYDKMRGVDSLLNKPRIQFLYLHHVFKDEERPLHLLLQTLQKNHTFITYSEAVDKILNRTIDKPYIAISSDDGFKNNMRAAEILNEYNAKACFFINPAIIGEKDFDKITTFCKSKLNFPPVEFLDWDDVHTLQKLGHEIGSHTMNHINVAATSPREIEEDMFKTYDVLSKLCGEAKHFAYPYGRFYDFNEVGRKACFDAGFISCATAERGCHVNHNRKLEKEELCILRDHVILDWDLSHVMFFLAKNSKKSNISNNLFPYPKSL